jgi:hypothetical protein
LKYIIARKGAEFLKQTVMAAERKTLMTAAMTRTSQKPGKK